jgi:crotonobetainyl-CoA:carnitine CoA-transferase CaiB-like acyl-CoA transferase
MEMNSPLASIRVLDISQGIAGALTSLLLADQGADVIRVQVGSSPRNDSPRDAVLGRNKRHVLYADWNDENRAAVRALAVEADVLVEDNSHGPLDLESLPPHLVRLSIRGFPRNDPRASHPAHDGLVGAATALFTDISLIRSILKLPPVYSSLPLPSVYAAAHGAIGIAAALLRRQAGAAGDALTVTLAASALSSMGVVIQDLKQPARYDTPPLPGGLARLALRLLRGLAQHPNLQRSMLNIGRSLVPPLLDAYRCSDGRLLYIVAMDHARHAPRLLDLLGLREKMRAAGMDAYPLYEESRSDNICEAALLGPLKKRKLRKAIASVLQTRPAADWERELSAHGVPCSVIRSSAEWLRDSAALAAALIMDVQDPVHGMVRQPGLAIDMGGRKAGADEVAGRRFISSGNPQWKAPALPRSAPFTFGASAPPLAGVRVLDLACVIAGPTCARTLGELGAEVIRIDSPNPLHGPRLSCLFGMDVNHGKQSILVDLNRREGRQIFQTLATEADIVVHNYSAEAFEKLNLLHGATDLDHLIWCRIAAFNGTQPGPRDSWRGYDPVLQAATGIMSRYGSVEQPELHGVASCVDYLTGYLAAYAAVLALYTRKAPVSMRKIGVSLAQAAQFIQLPMLWQHAKQQWDEPAGQHAAGAGLNDRLYRARDGWFFLVAKPDDLAAYASAAAGLTQPTEEGLAEYFRTRDYAEIHTAISAYGVTIEPVADAAELRRADSVFGRIGLIQTRNHPAGTKVTRVVPGYLQSEHWRLNEGSGFLQAGSDMRPVLTAAGYSPEQIDAWKEQGTVSLRWSEAYLPA